MINAAEEYNKDGHNIGVVPLPSPKGKDPVTVAGGQMMAVSSQSKDVDAAADFYFSGALEVMIQLMSQNGVQKPNLHIRRASL